MAGLVEQLQTDAVNPQTSVDTLLRKVKVAAVKLGLDDALEWVEKELQGYQSEEVDDIPDYRKGRGETLAWNPYHGWQPIEFGDSEMADIVSTVLLLEPIGSYERLLEKEKGSLHLPIPNGMVVQLNKMLNVSVPRMVNSISPGLVTKILQNARDMALDWALELSRAGIHGEGLSFSKEERESAANASISIGTFHGSFNTGDASGSGSQVNVTSQTEESTELFAQLRTSIEKEIEDRKDREAVLSALEELENARGKQPLLAAYDNFISSAANHMTVVAPFLPAIASIVANAA